MKRRASPVSCLFALCILGFCFDAEAQVPRLLNYQGRVTVGTANFEGNGQFKFALVNTNGTVTFWSNDGTSAAGSQPAAAVTLPVAKGLYSVLLGDTALANMTGLPTVAFTNPDVRLRVWFNDGVNGSQLLTPDQRLAPSAYFADGSVTTAAIAPGAVTTAAIGSNAVTGAKVAAGALNSTHVAANSLTFSNLAVPAAPGAGQILGFNGSSLVWQSAGATIFSLNGTSAYYNGGNVGIGSTAPVGKLEVVAQDALRLVGPQPFLTLLDNNAGFARSRIQGVGGGMSLQTENFINGSNPGGLITLAATGNVGIGNSPNPIGKLEVVAQDALRLIGFQPFLTLLDSNAGFARSRIQAVNGGFIFEPESFLNGSNPSAAVAITLTGLVGVGTTTPIAKFHSEINQPNAVAVYGKSTGASGIGVFGQSISGNAIVGQSTSGAAVHADGNATQARDKGGFAKAMAFINQDGTIGRCYNAVSGASSANCGFTSSRVASGLYDIDFGFQVDDRFFALTTLDNFPGGCGGGRVDVRLLTGNVARIQTWCPSGQADKPFMIIVY